MTRELSSEEIEEHEKELVKLHSSEELEDNICAVLIDMSHGFGLHLPIARLKAGLILNLIEDRLKCPKTSP